MAARTQNSARPSALDAPVPGQKAKSALDDFMASQSADIAIDSPQANASPDEAYAPIEMQAEEPAPVESPSTAGKVLDAAGKVLDYPGGFMRAGLANVAGMATGQANVTKEADLAKAVKGEGPNSAEYLRRLGVSEGGSVETPLGKVTLRGAEGLALDIATDPLVALAKLAKAVPYIGKVLNAPGKAAEAVGELLYKSGLKKVDAKLAEKGEAAVSDLLFQEGKAGTTAKLAQDVDQMSNTMGKVRQGLYDRAGQLGVEVPLDSFSRAEAVIAKMKSNPGLGPAAQELESLLQRYKDAGKASIDMVSDWKTTLYDSLPQSAFDGNSRLKGAAKRFKAALAGDFRQMIADTANGAEKGLGDSINAVNEKWGTLLAAKKPMAAQAKEAAGKGVGDWIDATILGGGIVASPQAGAAAVGARKMFQLANTTFAKTQLGRVLAEAGRKGVVDAVTRRALVDFARQQRGEAPSMLTPNPASALDAEE